jgi:autotransporter-associated beta strand protein
MNLNGGSLTAAEISTGNAGAAQRELNLNGGTLVAGADNTNFIHDLSTANVQSGGAIIDSAAYTVSVNQDLLGGADDGGLTKLGSGTLYLNGVNTYTNATAVSAGTLGGSGTIAGAVTVAPGARLAPGTALIGTLTINNSLSLAAGSSTLAKISMDGGAHNDLVTGLTSVAYNGALVVTNAGASPLVVGSHFHLFNAAGESGNFTSVTILPAGSGTFDPATGMLTITSSGSVVFNPVKLSGGNLILTGNGGAAPGSGYTLLTSTNVALPLSEWTTNTTGVLDDAGMFSNSIPMDAADTARFFDVRVP